MWIFSGKWIPGKGCEVPELHSEMAREKLEMCFFEVQHESPDGQKMWNGSFV